MTMLCPPSGLRIASARSRATLSVGPPAANGTTIVTGLSGYSAKAVAQARPAAAARRSRFIVALSECVGAKIVDAGPALHSQQKPMAAQRRCGSGEQFAKQARDVPCFAPGAVGDLVPTAGA